jgi:predicted aspartyl protease
MLRLCSSQSFLAFLLLASCATPPAGMPASGRPVSAPPCRQTVATSVPVYFDQEGVPVVIAAVGTTPAAMLVDTGAAGTIISHQLAAQLGMTGFFKEIKYPFVRFGSFGGPLEAFLEPGPAITLGNAQSKNMPIFVLVKPTPPEVLGTKSAIDGIMGNDIWTWNNVYLDFPDHNLVLFDQQSCLAPPADWPGRILHVPFSENFEGYIFLPVSIDGHHVTAILDTGAAKSVLPPPLMDAIGVRPENAAPIRVVGLVGAGGAVAADLDRFNQITIGGQNFSDPIFAVPHVRLSNFQQSHWVLPPTPQNSANPYLFFFLGEDFIRYHRIFISYSTHTLYIQDNH